MSIAVAISGKGGSGKTTIAAMLIRLLIEKMSSRSILAVDADPNACLGISLGVKPVVTISEIREQTRSKQSGNEGTDRLRSFEYGIQQAIVESKGFDLVTMGRPEGPSCYCAVNNILRQFLDKMSSQYQFVIIDNEAGMEHLSRRTTNNVDLLCIVAEPTPVGSLTARRIFELTKGLPICVKEIGVIWNNTKVDSVSGTLNKFEIPCLGCVPYDKAIFEASMRGKTVFEVEGNNPAYLAVREIIEDKLHFSR